MQGAIPSETAAEAVCLYPDCNQTFAKNRRKQFCSPKCRQKHFYHAFKKENGINYKKRPRPSNRYKIGSRTRLVGGVSSDGVHYMTHITVGTVHKRKYYSIKKLGEKGARLAAALQRTAWLIELRVWNPKDGDPFAILTYTDMFKGNDEYSDAVLDRHEISSPYISERDDKN